MIVFSTGSVDTPKDAHARHLASVPKGIEHRLYLGPLAGNAAAHLHMARSRDPAEIVCLLDADDWLTPGALEHVARAHNDGAWVTYGSWMFADGRHAPWQRAMTKEELESPREHPYLASHLKTFRAGLLAHLRPGELETPLGHGRDQALMFPLIDMAGPERVAHIAEVLYVYNWGNSFEFSASPHELAEEAAVVKIIRAREPHARLETL